MEEKERGRSRVGDRVIGRLGMVGQEMGMGYARWGEMTEWIRDMD